MLSLLAKDIVKRAYNVNNTITLYVVHVLLCDIRNEQKTNESISVVLGHI